MLTFNGVRYFNVNEGVNLRIESPYNIIDFTQSLINGYHPDGKIFKIDNNHETLIELEYQDLLEKMFYCNHINPLFVGLEECKGKDIITLQNLTENMPRGLSRDETRKFIMLNNYERKMLVDSGFTGYELTECYKALLKCKEIFGDNIEYTKSLNNFLHQNYVNDSIYNENPTLEELIAIYYQYPHLADLLSHGNRRGASLVYSYLHSFENKAEKENWLFNNKHTERLNKLEEIASYSYNNHDYDDDVIAVFLERNISSLLTSTLIPTPNPYIDMTNEDKLPNAIIVQSNLGEEDKRNTKFEPKFKNNFRADTLDVDNTKYILNLNKIGEDIKVDKFYESLSIKELGIQIELDERAFNDRNRNLIVVQKVLDKINSMNLLPEQLSIDDICKIFERDSVNIYGITTIETLEETLQALNEKINFKSVPELNDIHVTHIVGDKCMISPEQYFIHCIHAVEMRFLTSNESNILDVVTDRQYHRNQYSKKPMFIMPKEMIQSLDLPTVESIRGVVIKDTNIINMSKRTKYVDMLNVIENKTLGYTPIIETKSPYMALISAFKEKYGRVPRIMPQISVALDNYFKGNLEECVNSFNYKSVSKIQGAKTPIMVKLSSAFDWNRTPLELQQLLKYNVTSTNIEAICKYSDIIREFYDNAKNKDLLEFMDVINKIPDEAISSVKEKVALLNQETDINKKNQIRLDIQMDIRTLISYTQQQKGLIDARQAEKEYNYSTINNSSSIMGDDICIMSGPYKAYFLNSLDARHFSVGYDTACCQHMGGAGEECVIAATTSPHCGTFVIESDGVIKAQAFVWESLNRDGNKVLVLDNIEFANDKDATDYLEILYGFCKESPYDTIHMGLSYNVVSNIGRAINNTEYVDRPETVRMDEFYSDYDSVVALKTNGEMEFDVSKAKYYIHNFETPTIMESSMHCINKTSNTLVAQHYDEIYDNKAKTTMVFSPDGTRKQPDIIKPTYSFDTTTPSKHNNIMKWNNIQPGDIAITVTYTHHKEFQEVEQYTIKPISFDGKTIATPNEAQCASIYEAMKELTNNSLLAFASIETKDGTKEITDPNILLNINTENYTSPSMYTLYYDELEELKKPRDGDQPDFGGDNQSFVGELGDNVQQEDVPPYYEDEYPNYEEEYEDDYEQEEIEY